MKKIIFTTAVLASSLVSPIIASANSFSQIDAKVVIDSNKNGIFAKEEYWNVMGSFWNRTSQAGGLIVHPLQDDFDTKVATNSEWMGTVDIEAGNMIAVRLTPTNMDANRNAKITFDIPVCVHTNLLPDKNKANGENTKEENCSVTEINTILDEQVFEYIFNADGSDKEWKEYYTEWNYTEWKQYVKDTIYQNIKSMPVIFKIPETYTRGNSITMTIEHAWETQKYTFNITGKYSESLKELADAIRNFTLKVGVENRIDINAFLKESTKKHFFLIDETNTNIKQSDETVITMTPKENETFSFQVCDINQVIDPTINEIQNEPAIM